MRIIIAPFNAIQTVKKRLLNEAPLILNVDIVSFTQYFEKYHAIKKISNAQLHLAIYQALKHLPMTHYFKRLCEDIHFIKQVVNVHVEVQKYDLALSRIRDEATRSLFTQIAPIETFECNVRQCVQQYTFENVEIIDGNYSFFEMQMIQQMRKKNARMDTTRQLDAHIQVRKAASMKDEIELLANLLVQQKEDLADTCILYSEASYVPVLTSTLQRYQIPFHFESNVYQSKLTHLWQQAIQYYLTQDNVYEMLVLSNLFHLETTKVQKLKKYFEIFKTFEDTTHLKEIDFEAVLTNQFDIEHPEKCLNIFPNEYSFTYLKNLEEEVDAIIQVILPQLKALAKQTFKDYLQMIYQYTSAHVQNEIDLNVQEKIRELLVDIHPYLNDSYTQTFLQETLSFITTTASQKQGVVINELQSSQLFKDRMYVVGSNEQAMKRFSIIEGLFNETMHDMWKEMQNYPSIAERYQHFISRIFNTFHASKVCYLYANLNSEGKEEFCVNELTHLDQAPLYQSAANTTEYERNFSMDEKTAYALYVKDHTFKASVSSIQLYNQCPFEYFLRYGLKINLVQEEGFSPIVKGNLFHFLLEKYATIAQKQYALYGIQHFEADLQKHFSFYHKVLLKKYEEMYLLDESSMMYTLKNSLLFLEALEKNSPFTPYVLEKPYQFQIDGTPHLLVKGRIDRIDKNDQYLQVMDYKSSHKTFSVTAFKQGIDLQLPTYIYAVNTFLQQHHLFAAFYMPLTQKKVVQLNGISFSKALQQEEYFKIKSSKDFSFKDVLEGVPYIYTATMKNILSGNIENNIHPQYTFYSLDQKFGTTKELTLMYDKGDENE